MLIQYGFRNYFGFKEGATVSLELPSACPKDVSAGAEFTNIICVKGKNGAGKTNLLKAFSFLSDFCTNSFSLKPDELIAFSNFYNNDDVTEFFIEFKKNDIIFRYELELTDEAVSRETLYRTEKRKTKIIERLDNSFTTLISGLSTLKSMKLRSNASFISTANQYDFDDVEPVNITFDFFYHNMSNIGYTGLDRNTPDLSAISKVYYENETMFNFVKELIVNCDTGVSDITIVKREVNDKVEYRPLFTHLVDGEEKHITYYTESSGTKSLYNQLYRYKFALQYGGVLCLDEFDINLHPHILPVLIKLFTSKESNPEGGQLLFSTHNSEILDTLGKYRTYFVDKDNNESFAYRLDEIPSDLIRNDRTMLPVYNSGKIGGVPNL